LPEDIPPRTVWALEQAGVHPLLARLFAARGVRAKDELDDGLARLLPPDTLRGTHEAAVLLADAIALDKRLCIVADYDCDGATACAVGVRGLRLLGAKHVSYLVPDRVVDGYGLTPPIAERVADSGADMLITVDNGIASVEGVAAAKARGLQVLVTDHHLPGPELPVADVLVNPNQPGCDFESKSIAGVGVMFYVLLALRSELRKRGVFDVATQPKLDALLPLVALGTVADVVKLDANNRRLVAQGLRRIRAGAMPAGVAALFKAAGRTSSVATTFDFGFALGPRINAAGRLADMTLGIECLLTDDAGRADELARMLDGINRERRDIEGGMRDQALLLAESLFATTTAKASRRRRRPSACSTRASTKAWSASWPRASRTAFTGRPSSSRRAARRARSTSSRARAARFRAFICAMRSTSWPSATRACCCASAAMPWRPAAPWRASTSRPSRRAWRRSRANGWPRPRSRGRSRPTGPSRASTCASTWSTRCTRRCGARASRRRPSAKRSRWCRSGWWAKSTWRSSCKHQGQPIDAIWFSHTEPLPPKVKLAFRLDADEWQGVRRLRFLVEGAEF
jgi:single-stranded-DNA-specific exonuclease